MSPLITLDYAKKHVRLDHDVEDTDLSRKISAASVLLVKYLKTGALGFLDENGDLLPDMAVPANVQSACATLVGILFKDRDGENPDLWPLGYLPWPAINQLYMDRDPVVA